MALRVLFWGAHLLRKGHVSSLYGMASRKLAFYRTFFLSHVNKPVSDWLRSLLSIFHNEPKGGQGIGYAIDQQILEAGLKQSSVEARHSRLRSIGLKRNFHRNCFSPIQSTGNFHQGCKLASVVCITAAPRSGPGPRWTGHCANIYRER